MRTILHTVLLLLAPAPAAFAAAQQVPDSPVPPLSSLAGDWMDANTLRNRPAVHNFVGGLKTTANLTGLECLTLAPYAQGGTAGNISVNGKPVTATESRWLPYEVKRRATLDGIKMESTIRMPFEQHGVLTRLTLENTSTETRTLKVMLDATVCVRHLRHIPWQGRHTVVSDASGLKLEIE